ncbi:hypothetical protein N015_00685 [Pseudomonas asturiensis]|uniref:ABC transporter permease n=1 Tax=Pseudomonas asturiensis TaxID=1190415 RepID=A0ABX6H634_9PSED|nr:hypothetical protein [Pseudomonas asturiensis]QHF00999.1 hypothetical protein N015_00685 [Pseudomonas asturiensis]
MSIINAVQEPTASSSFKLRPSSDMPKLFLADFASHLWEVFRFKNAFWTI